MIKKQLIRIGAIFAVGLAALTIASCESPMSTEAPPFEGILVTSVADSGPGSLRQAVIDAEPGEEIRFAQDMTITLEGDRRGIEIDKDITINGVGRTVVIEGSGEQRHFTHMPGGPYSLTIANLTLRNGEPRMGSLLPGGSIYVGGGSTATIDNVTFESNLGTNGGAIFVEQPHGTTTVHVTGSTFANNEARGSSGVGAPAGAGGAIFTFDTNLVIEDSVFEDNFTLNGNTQLAEAISGGAVAIFRGSQSVVRDSAFRRNRAGLSGGAINTYESSLDVIRSTFEENLAGLNGTQHLSGPHTGGAINAIGRTDEDYVLRIGLSRFVRNRAEGPENSSLSNPMFRGGAVSTLWQPLAVFSSEFFGNYVGDTGTDGVSASVNTNSGSAIYHVAWNATDGMVISSSTFVGNVASGAGYGAGTAQGSAVASESSSIVYDISFSTFADNQGTAGHSNFWFAGDNLYLIGSAFRDGSFALPDPPVDSADIRLVLDVIAPSDQIGEGSDWPGGNLNAVPDFLSPPFVGSDSVWGTEDDLYGDLAPFATSNLLNAGNADDLPPDIMDLNGNGNTSEPLPFDARGNPRQSGSAPDIGAYERQL